MAIGDSDQFDGAGRITVPDNEWKDALAKLASAAQLIFMVPAASPGCIYEVEWLLASGLISKTVFVMPPSSMMTRAERRHLSDEWSRATAGLHETGLSLPGLQKRGALFVFNQMCALALTVRFPSLRTSFPTTPSRVRKWVLDLKGVASGARP